LFLVMLAAIGVVLPSPYGWAEERQASLDDFFVSPSAFSPRQLAADFGGRLSQTYPTHDEISGAPRRRAHLEKPRELLGARRETECAGLSHVGTIASFPSSRCARALDSGATTVVTPAWTSRRLRPSAAQPRRRSRARRSAWTAAVGRRRPRRPPERLRDRQIHGTMRTRAPVSSFSLLVRTASPSRSERERDGSAGELELRTRSRVREGRRMMTRSPRSPRHRARVGTSARVIVGRVEQLEERSSRKEATGDPRAKARSRPSSSKSSSIARHRARILALARGEAPSREDRAEHRRAARPVALVRFGSTRPTWRSRCVDDVGSPLRWDVIWRSFEQALVKRAPQRVPRPRLAAERHALGATSNEAKFSFIVETRHRHPWTRSAKADGAVFSTRLGEGGSGLGLTSRRRS
jgi:hypothetical protein